jgi:pimeloyl-ACP methyl ester carboxylesterase
MKRAEAVAYVQGIAQTIYPRYGLTDWEAFVERTFRMLPDGRWVLDYDPAIVRTINPWVLRMLRPLLWHSFRRLARGCPTLLLRGETSDILGRELALRMVAAAPGTRLAEVPEVGHAPSLSEREARAAIADLLARVE